MQRLPSSASEPPMSALGPKADVPSYAGALARAGAGQRFQPVDV